MNMQKALFHIDRAVSATERAGQHLNDVAETTETSIAPARAVASVYLLVLESIEDSLADHANEMPVEGCVDLTPLAETLARNALKVLDVMAASNAKLSTERFNGLYEKLRDAVAQLDQMDAPRVAE